MDIVAYYATPAEAEASTVRAALIFPENLTQRGANASQLLPNILWLLGFTFIMLAIATKRFHKSLD